MAAARMATAPCPARATGSARPALWPEHIGNRVRQPAAGRYGDTGSRKRLRATGDQHDPFSGGRRGHTCRLFVTGRTGECLVIGRAAAAHSAVPWIMRAT
ncbi:hypothetical protein [Accumulibacter sp.]|uniref:hypothetical protein n=1 Tax=Accumulibacter sp. TaxID=2053492 RepID=UPI0025D43D40|nr:hypothetical protein [Accumulibacter sp.]MCM8627518.1 hypothetical protein [Accumulibacter sp.]